MSSPLTHYIVIRRDLTFGEYSAQLAHAGEAYLQRRDYETAAWARFMDPGPLDEGKTPPIWLHFNETTAIVKGARNEGRLVKLEALLVAAKVAHVAIREETGPKGGRIAGQLTVISLMPIEREAVEALVREFHTIEGLDGPK